VFCDYINYINGQDTTINLYTWSTRSSNITLTGLSPGTYSSSTINSNGCQEINPVTIAAPPPNTPTTTVTGNVRQPGFL